MNAITYTDLRQNLKSYMDYVFDNNEPLIITRKKRENVVLLSIDDYNSLVETEYLMSSPANVTHLKKSLKQARAGKLLKRKLKTA